MSSALDAGLWKYLGPVAPTVAPSNEDALYLDVRIKATQKARVRDADERIDWPQTYELILQGAREQLHRKHGYEYVLNITKPKRPELKLVLSERATHPYYTWADVLAAKTRTSTSEADVRSAKVRQVFKKRKGWTNNFFFRK